MKVLIVSYRREDLLRRCVSQLSTYFTMSELLVVDNHSDNSAAIAKFCAAEGIEVLPNPSNEGFAKAVNTGMRSILHGGQESWVLLINPDTELFTDPRKLIAASDVNTACITTFDSGASSPWDCKKPIPNPWRAAWEDSGFGRFRLPQPLGSRYRSFSDRHRGYLVGCFLIVSTAAWIRIGEFDERFWLYSEESDWCMRVHQSGMTCKVIPILGYRHYAGQTSSGDAAARRRAENAYAASRKIFIEKHWGRLGLRVYNLSLSSLTTLRRSVRAAKDLRRRLG